MVLEIVFGSLLIVSIWVIYNLYNNLVKFETNYLELEEAKLKDETFILELRKKVLAYRSQLRQMDSIGAFEADDEVGFFFKELNQMIEEISVYFDITDDFRESTANDFSTIIRSRYGEES